MTIIKHARQRVGVLIDAQNLYHSAQNLYGSRVNFTEVLEEAVAGRFLIRAIAYVITSESGDEETFFEALENAGIETKSKDLQVFHGGAKKADWDVGIAMDAVKLAPHLDALVIASGDGDFVPMIEYVQQSAGCQVEVISFGRSSSSKLIDVADDFIDMDQETNRFLMRSRVARSHNKRKNRVRNSTRVSNGPNKVEPNQKKNTPTEKKQKQTPMPKEEVKKAPVKKPTQKSVKKAETKKPVAVNKPKKQPKKTPVTTAKKPTRKSVKKVSAEK